jgi:hypothetical protein
MVSKRTVARNSQTGVIDSSRAAYANGWYDKTRDDGCRFCSVVQGPLPPSYLQGMWDRPGSGLRGVNLRGRQQKIDTALSHAA